MNKEKHFRYLKDVLFALCGILALIVLFVSSPLHPKNITDETVVRKGVEFTVKLTGVRNYDEKGFTPLTDRFSLDAEKVYLYEDKEGYARTDSEVKSRYYILGKYNSDKVIYEKYSFCGQEYKSREDIEAFFEIPDLIYDFDINKLSEYVQNTINCKKSFSGKATAKIYRGRIVLTEIYIGTEKILELR